MRTYSKPALTIEQQIALLESRGLSIPDLARAVRHLSNISYYRLSAYMLPYRVLDASGILAANLTEHKIRQVKVVNLCSYGKRKKISEVQEHGGAGTATRRVS